MAKEPSIFDCRRFDFRLEFISYDSSECGRFEVKNRRTSELVYKVAGVAEDRFGKIF